MRSREEEEGRAQINRKRGGEGRQEIGNICFFFFAPNSFSPRVAPDNADASSRGEREELILSRWRKIEGEAREGKGERWDGMGWDASLPSRTGPFGTGKENFLGAKIAFNPGERERRKGELLNRERERREKWRKRGGDKWRGISFALSPLCLPRFGGVERKSEDAATEGENVRTVSAEANVGRLKKLSLKETGKLSGTHIFSR